MPLLCADRLTDAQIAQLVGVARPTLARWKKKPEFRAEMNRQSAASIERIFRGAVAELQDGWSITED